MKNENSAAFNIGKVKETINGAKLSNQVPPKIIEIVEALCQTYENVAYSADANAPEAVKIFVSQIQKKLISAEEILESQIKENRTYSNKKDLFMNFETIVKDYKEIGTLLSVMKKDMMGFYNTQQPKNYGNY